jgi:secreted PhoX family phosphatase
MRDKAGFWGCAARTKLTRAEGIWWGDNELYLTATSGGPIQRGQILRYVPSPEEGRPGESRRPGRVQLFVESTDLKTLNMGDNLTIAPWGHLIVCEDNYSTEVKNHLKGVTPEGKLYTLAQVISRLNPPGLSPEVAKIIDKLVVRNLFTDGDKG